MLIAGFYYLALFSRCNRWQKLNSKMQKTIPSLGTVGVSSDLIIFFSIPFVTNKYC